MTTYNQSVNDYIATFPAETQVILGKIRNIIHNLAPQAEESISYGMPGYKVNGKPLIYFAAYKKHIGIYATPTAHIAFSTELAQYKQGKGSVQFPLDKPIPYELIKQMVEFKLKESLN
jgi:uncharacterized protein YdhG (YjbR/CyaY superfamily)